MIGNFQSFMAGNNQLIIRNILNITDEAADGITFVTVSKYHSESF